MHLLPLTVGSWDFPHRHLSPGKLKDIDSPGGCDSINIHGRSAASSERAALTSPPSVTPTPTAGCVPWVYTVIEPWLIFQTLTTSCAVIDLTSVPSTKAAAAPQA